MKLICIREFQRSLSIYVSPNQTFCIQFVNDVYVTWVEYKNKKKINASVFGKNTDTLKRIGPALQSSGQGSWLQIQRSGFDSRHYQIFWEVVGLERGPLSRVSTTEELHGRKINGSGLEMWEYGRRDPLRWSRGTFHLQTLALNSPTSGGRSVRIVRWRTQAMEFTTYRLTTSETTFSLQLIFKHAR
jgi:hypothetical protein